MPHSLTKSRDSCLKKCTSIHVGDCKLPLQYPLNSWGIHLMTKLTDYENACKWKNIQIFVSIIIGFVDPKFMANTLTVADSVHYCSDNWDSNEGNC